MAEIIKIWKALWHPGWTGLSREPTLQEKSVFSDVLRYALIRWQLEFGFTPTGEPDDETLRLLLRARCGREDLRDLEPAAFTAAPGKLRPEMLFQIDTTNSPLPLDVVSDVIHDSLSQWSEPLGVRWRRGDPADVTVRFKPIDVEDMVLARAWSLADVQNRGVVEFDTNEDWDVKYDFHTIALHECGHVFGLEHSFNRNAVMTPYYEGVRRALTQGDIRALRNLYGR